MDACQMTDRSSDKTGILCSEKLLSDSMLWKRCKRWIEWESASHSSEGRAASQARFKGEAEARFRSISVMFFRPYAFVQWLL
jgi:hypothetical protein